MIIILILVIAFIGIILHLSFAGAEPEVKIGGLTFFISLFLIGPFFQGMLSIHAPVPMDPENTIDIVSIIVAAIMAGIAIGIYKIIDKIQYDARQKKLEEERKRRTQG